MSGVGEVHVEDQRAERAAEGKREVRWSIRRNARSDPPRDRRVAVRGRGPPQAVGAPAPPQHLHQPQARAAPVPRGRPAGADGEGPPPRAPAARGDDHRRAPGHPLGDRPDRGVDRPRWALRGLLPPRPRHRRGVGGRRAKDGSLRGRRPCCARRAASALARSRGRSRTGSRCATTAARAFARATTRPSSTTSASSARPLFTTSPRPTAASRSSFRRSRSRCSGSSASTRSRPSVRASVSSRATTTSTGCLSATTTAHRARRASACWPPRTDDRSVAPPRPRRSDHLPRPPFRATARIGPDPA